MSSLVDAKRSFYRQPAVAAAYDQQRFGGASGNYVNERELATVAALLPSSPAILADIGCGTGRLLHLLATTQSSGSPSTQTPTPSTPHPASGTSQAGSTTFLLGLDTSLPMLREARLKSQASFAQADAFSLPVTNGACDAITSLRVLFHFDDVHPLLKEMRRIAKPGGRMVCDTSAWSPRKLLPLGRDRWGERVATIGRARFRALAQSAGWGVVEERPCFLISPYMYRRLPLRLARALERLERHLPEPLLCRVFWSLEAR